MDPDSKTTMSSSSSTRQGIWPKGCGFFDRSPMEKSKPSSKAAQLTRGDLNEKGDKDQFGPDHRWVGGWLTLNRVNHKESVPLKGRPAYSSVKVHSER